ncbi:UNVERIFIED_CONTAM: hypothetical protein LK11_04330 [Mumia flava]
MVTPTLEFAFEARVACEPPKRIGHGAGDELVFVPIVGGTVAGPLLDGRVLPGGGDWSITRGPRVCELDARYLIESDDGTVIDIVNRGFYAADPSVIERSQRGEDVPTSEYYFRTQPVFRTDAPAHAWLSETVFVGWAYDDLRNGQVCIRFFAVR